MFNLKHIQLFSAICITLFPLAVAAQDFFINGEYSDFALAENEHYLVETTQTRDNSSGGTGINNPFVVGTRFRLTHSTTITWVGGNMYTNTPLSSRPNAWTAIVENDPVTNMPPIRNSYSSALTHAVWSAEMQIPQWTSRDVMVPVGVTLPPGSYSLVFSSYIPITQVAAIRCSRGCIPTPGADNINLNTWGDGLADWVEAPTIHGRMLVVAERANDGDFDGVPDDSDNCREIANPEQIDQDLDGLGNECDPDLDGDGIANTTDNCVDFENPAQSDFDGDGIGDACDNDADGDSVNDDVDNCVGVSNSTQSDSDGDGIGDACDPDDDNDGVHDAGDNCPLLYNPTQTDFDHDGDGDACDGDKDGDGVVNDLDQCLESPADQVVNVAGCTGVQMVDLECGQLDWVNRGAYVSCVAVTSKSAMEQGLLDAQQRARLVRNAAHSN